MKEYKIIEGNCIEGMKQIPDGCIHTCITPPPYFALRNYEGGEEDATILNAKNVLAIVMMGSDTLENKNMVVGLVSNIISDHKKTTEKLSDIKITNVDLQLENCVLRNRLTELLIEADTAQRTFWDDMESPNG